MICNNSGQGSFTASRRSIKNYRSELIGSNGTAKKSSFSNNMILTNIFVKVPWPHSCSQRFLSQFDLFKK